MKLLDSVLLEAWRGYRRLGLHHISHTVIGLSPRVVRRQVERLKGELSILNRRRFTPLSELQRFYRKALIMLAEQRAGATMGDYLEFGVFNGTSLIAMYRALVDLQLYDVRLFGFDSFEGLPPDEEGHWGPGGRFCCSIDTTRKILSREGVDLSRVTLIKGYFNDTLTDELRKVHHLQRASVVMVDCDLYRSTVECLAFSRHLMTDDVVVVFDDWHPLAAQNKGEKRAFDEFLAAHREFSARPLGQYCAQAEAFLLSTPSVATPRV